MSDRIADRATPSGPACGCAVCASGTVEAGAPSIDRRFRVEGMDCADEVALLKREVGRRVGPDNLAFDLLSGEMRVACSAEVAPDDLIVAAAARVGLRAVPLIEVQRTDPRPGERRWRSLAATISGGAVLSGLITHAAMSGSPLEALGLMAPSSGTPAPVAALYLIATLAGAWFVLPRAWLALSSWRPDMNLLMTIAVTGAMGLGEFLEAASVSFLFAVALLLESWSVAHARGAVRALLDLAPPTARLLDPESPSGRDVAVGAVGVGDIIIVKPGERIPLDGEVTKGAAFIDVSPVTGESAPKEVGPGDPVFAGSLSADGALEIRVTHAAADTFVARMVRRVVEAGRRRGRAERWVDRFALFYTPSVLALAVIVALVPPLAGFGAWSEWLYRSLVLLVIGCPCALVISTPVSVIAGLASAARHGVLVKGGDILEVPARLGAIAFDKTGTVTEGRPKVTSVVSRGDWDEAHVLAVAAALEQRSTHPIALAITGGAAARGLTPPPASDVRTLPGRGVEGTVNGRTAWLGSARLLAERNGSDPFIDRVLDRAALRGQSVVVVGEQEHVCGVITLADAPRAAAAAVVGELKALGMNDVVLLTGDSPHAAALAATKVGIEEVHSGLLPEEKAALIEAFRLKLNGHRSLVAFVGDGINDAPALAAADLGIAMGEAGSDAAIETADVALVASDLTRLPWLVRHSRRLSRIIRVNVGFALAVKAAFVLLTALGHASLWAAIAADMGASLAVIANSLRLLRA